MSELSAKAAPEASQLEGPWHLVSCTDFQLSESGVCTASPHSDQAEGCVWMQQFSGRTTSFMRGFTELCPTGQ